MTNVARNCRSSRLINAHGTLHAPFPTCLFPIYTAVRRPHPPSCGAPTAEMVKIICQPSRLIGDRLPRHKIVHYLPPLDLRRRRHFTFPRRARLPALHVELFCVQ
jgi:hypothetical protein